MRRAVVLTLLVALGLGGVAGCTQRAATRAVPSGPSCLAGATGPAGPSTSTAGRSGTPTAGPSTPTAGRSGTAGDPLPDLTLPCLDGGRPVALSEIAGPAVVNLWASWCGPCRQELPAFQRYAERVAGQVRVVGVATNDSAPLSRQLAAELHLTFPLLADDQGRLLAAVGRAALPATLFVDAQGRVSYVYNAQALDAPALAELVERHLGVVVG